MTTTGESPSDGEVPTGFNVTATYGDVTKAVKGYLDTSGEVPEWIEPRDVLKTALDHNGRSMTFAVPHIVAWAE